MTVQTPDGRRVARLTVPRHLTGPGPEIRCVRLLELSSEGARIKHLEPLDEGLAFYVDLPPALGRVRLNGKVVWTKLYKREQDCEGGSWTFYQSGLAFINLTPEQQGKLAVTLQFLDYTNRGFEEHPEGRQGEGGLQELPSLIRSRRTQPSTIHAYEIQNDRTAIDTFLRGFREYLANDRIRLSVSGLAGPPRRLSRTHVSISVCPPSRERTGESRWMKKYKVGILLSANYWELQELVQRAKTAEPYSSADYYDTYLQPIADEIDMRVRNCVGPYDPRFEVSAGIKSNGMISAWILMDLRITAYDAVVHCGTHLTDYPRRFLTELASVVEKELVKNPALMLSIYEYTDFKYEFFRRAEQALREKHNVPLIGERYLSEISLYRLIKKYCPDAKHDHGPPWLGKQRFDIYLPSLRVAIEYNDQQHYEPIEVYGGAEGFEQIKARDERKKRLARENRVTLYEWPYTDPISEDKVKRLLEGFKGS